MTNPFMGEIRAVSFGFAPKGWAQCNGQLMPVSQNQALFALLGTVYGGDGQLTFGLPDLRARAAMHVSPTHAMGEVAGTPTYTLNVTEMPQHNHTLSVNTTTVIARNVHEPTAGMSLGQSGGTSSSQGDFDVNIYSTQPTNPTPLAPQSVGAVGGQAHENRQPYLGVNFMIALTGIFPSRN